MRVHVLMCVSVCECVNMCFITRLHRLGCVIFVDDGHVTVSKGQMHQIKISPQIHKVSLDLPTEHNVRRPLYA